MAVNLNAQQMATAAVAIMYHDGRPQSVRSSPAPGRSSQSFTASVVAPSASSSPRRPSPCHGATHPAAQATLPARPAPPTPSAAAAAETIPRRTTAMQCPTPEPEMRRRPPEMPRARTTTTMAMAMATPTETPRLAGVRADDSVAHRSKRGRPRRNRAEVLVKQPQSQQQQQMQMQSARRESILPLYLENGTPRLAPIKTECLRAFLTSEYGNDFGGKWKSKESSAKPVNIPSIREVLEMSHRDLTAQDSSTTNTIPTAMHPMSKRTSVSAVASLPTPESSPPPQSLYATSQISPPTTHAASFPSFQIPDPYMHTSGESDFHRRVRINSAREASRKLAFETGREAPDLPYMCPFCGVDVEGRLAWEGHITGRHSRVREFKIFLGE